MSKVYYFITFTIGITLLMKMAGIPFGGESVLEWFGITTTSIFIKSTLFYIAVVSIFVVGATIGSIFSKESTLVALFANGMLGVGIGAFIGILNYVRDFNDATNSWVFSVVLLIFGVYMVGFVISMIEWWRGSG